MRSHISRHFTAELKAKLVFEDSCATGSTPALRGVVTVAKANEVQLVEAALHATAAGSTQGAEAHADAMSTDRAPPAALT